MLRICYRLPAEQVEYIQAQGGAEYLRKLIERERQGLRAGSEPKPY